MDTDRDDELRGSVSRPVPVPMAGPPAGAGSPGSMLRKSAVVAQAGQLR